MKKGNELLISIRQLVTEMGEKRSERRSVSRKREYSVYSASGQKMNNNDGKGDVMMSNSSNTYNR